MMATVAELGVGPGSSRLGYSASFEAGDGPSVAAGCSVLVLVGLLRSGESLERLLMHIEAGVRCWPVDLDVSVLDQQLKLFVSRHSAFLSEQDPGQRTLQHHGDVLDTQVVLNPTHDLVCSEVRRLLCAPSQQKLLVLAGSTLDAGGDLLLQSGCFSPHHLLNICTELQEGELLSQGNPALRTTLTLSCPHPGPWRVLQQQWQSISWLQLQVAPPAVLPKMEGLQEFTEYLSECLEPPTPFDLLEPPATAGFLRLWRPCCYVFPGGRGHAAFLAVSGFNLLLDGGSDLRPTFWKLLRHLERVDGLLLTHLGEDNLPAVNSLLLRKVAERECAPSGLDKEDWSQEQDPDLDLEQRPRRLLSPELGLVFLNTPARLRPLMEEPGRLSGPGQAALTLQLLDRLDLQPEPLVRTSSQPILLFSKMGVGRLEMFVLNPVAGSASLNAFQNTWPQQGSEDLPLDCLVSTCVLLVWHPAGPLDKIVRLLFPGCCPQNLILDGLEKLQHLEFLRHSSICLKDLKDLREPRSSESGESLKTSVKTGSGSLKDKLGRTEGRKLEQKVKPRPPAAGGGAGAGEAPPKEKKDGDKTKPKEPELKAKINKPTEKIQKKEMPKEEKMDEKKEEKKEKPVVEKKKEVVKKEASSLKLKKEPKPEARKDGKKEPKTEENKLSKMKEVKKVISSSADVRRALPKSGTLKKDGSLQKKEVRGARGTRDQNKREDEVCEVSTPEDPTAELEEKQIGAGGAAMKQNLTSLTPEISPPSPETGEQVLPSAGAPLVLHHNGDLTEILSSVPHDVDLCLVTPCEFQHPKTPQHLLELPGPPTSSGTSSSTTTTTINSITPGSSPRSDETPFSSSVSPVLLPLSDQPQAPQRDLPPPPPQPGACMVDPEEKNQKATASRTKKPPVAGQKGTSSGASRARVGVSSGSLKVTPILESRGSGRSSLGGPRVGTQRPLSSGSRASPASPPPDDGAECAVFYLDLVYLPGGAALSTLDSLFFRRVRSSHYVISGDDGEKSATLRRVLDTLLEAKTSWPQQQVTLIPTFDPVAMHHWYQETLQKQQQQQVTVLGSNSTVAMQENTFPACKVQF